MKKFRLVFAGLLAIAFVGALFAFTSNVEGSKAKRFTTDTYDWTGAAHTPAINFQIGVTSSSELNNTSNWGTSNPGCSGSGYICKATATYTLSGSQSAPTEAQITQAIKDQYDLNQSPRFPVSGWTVSIGGVSVTIVVIQKSVI